MYRGVIQQRADITEYLRDHIMHAQARAARSAWAASIASCTRRRSATRPSALSKRDAGAARRRAVASERLVARHGAAAAGRARRSLGRPALDEGCAGSARDWRTRLHALWTLDGIDGIDAGDRDQGAGRSVARRARRRRSGSRSVAGRREQPGPGRGAEAARRSGLERAAAVGGVAGRPARREPRERAIAALLERHGDDPVAWTRR